MARTVLHFGGWTVFEEPIGRGDINECVSLLNSYGLATYTTTKYAQYFMMFGHKTQLDWERVCDRLAIYPIQNKVYIYQDAYMCTTGQTPHDPRLITDFAGGHEFLLPFMIQQVEALHNRNQKPVNPLLLVWDRPLRMM